VGEKADSNNRPTVKKLYLMGCLLHAGRSHTLSCIKNRIETTRRRSLLDAALAETFFVR